MFRSDGNRAIITVATAGQVGRLKLVTPLVLLACAGLTAACGAAPAPPPLAPAPVRPARVVHPTPVPADRPDDPPPRRWVQVDWSTVHLASDADAIALWKRIAPTGEDWDVKLGEVPTPIAHQLAIALLHEGNFTCVLPQPIVQQCAMPPVDLGDPAPNATIAEPCLRRWLAIWALGQLDESDLPAIHDSLLALAAMPPPENQLVSAALSFAPSDDGALRLELLALAAAAGHTDLASSSVGGLDTAALTEAATRLHIDGAVEVLSAEANRAVYLTAVADKKLRLVTRIESLHDLVDADDASNNGKPLPDLQRLLVATTRDTDCELAATAADLLREHGDLRFVPTRPHTRSPAVMMRQLCVLASWDRLPPSDQLPLDSWLPLQGVDQAVVTYDPNNTIDADGDGDPHFERVTDRISRDQFQLPDLEQMVAAFAHCTGTTCKTDDREFRFGFKPGPGGDLLLASVDSIDRGPCDKSAIPKR